MKQIRQGAFETNSSSSHSITIAAGEYIPDGLPLVNGVCEIHTGEFGWESENYSGALFSIGLVFCILATIIVLAYDVCRCSEIC